MTRPASIALTPVKLPALLAMFVATSACAFTFDSSTEGAIADSTRRSVLRTSSPPDDRLHGCESATAYQPYWQRHDHGSDALRASTTTLCLARQLETLVDPSFDHLTIEMKNAFANLWPAKIDIDADGNVTFAVDAVERLEMDAYSATFVLSEEDRRDLLSALVASDWSAPLPRADSPPVGHPTQYKITLQRDGQTRTIEMEVSELADKRIEGYRQLLTFLSRLHRQENLIQRLQQPKSRRFALHDLDNEIRALHEHPRSPPYYRMLDWSRLTDSFEHLLDWSPGDEFDPLEMSVAVRIAGHRRSAMDWEYVSRLRHSDNAQVQQAIVDAAVGWNNKESIELMQNMTDSFGYAAWGLIRCGDAAIPQIISIIEGKTRQSRQDMRYETMFRAYVTHWDALPTPVDARIARAVTKSMSSPGILRTQHHQEFLDKFAEGRKNPWGTSAHGVAVRLRPVADSWRQNRPGKLLADIRNLGKSQWTIVRSDSCCQLEVDGQWYQLNPNGKSSPLFPGTTYSNLAIETSRGWMRIDDHQPLALPVGKHTLRLAMFVEPHQDRSLQTQKIVSNGIQVTITPPLSRKEEAELVEAMRAKEQQLAKQAEAEKQRALEQQNKNEK